jgi:hypothetical protein
VGSAEAANGPGKSEPRRKPGQRGGQGEGYCPTQSPRTDAPVDSARDLLPMKKPPQGWSSCRGFLEVFASRDASGITTQAKFTNEAGEPPSQKSLNSLTIHAPAKSPLAGALCRVRKCWGLTYPRGRVGAGNGVAKITKSSSRYLASRRASPPPTSLAA